MGWYQVVKTVKGHKYLYLQTSWREGGKVKTKSKYLGRYEPSAPARISMPPYLDFCYRCEKEKMISDPIDHRCDDCMR